MIVWKCSRIKLKIKTNINLKTVLTVDFFYIEPISLWVLKRDSKLRRSASQCKHDIPESLLKHVIEETNGSLFTPIVYGKMNTY